MRLQPAQREVITTLVRSMVPPESSYELRLFGSRLNEQAKGGDVDLYLEVAGMEATALATLQRGLRVRLEEAMDLPVDLTIQQRGAPLNLVSRLAKEEGIRL